MEKETSEVEIFTAEILSIQSEFQDTTAVRRAVFDALEKARQPTAQPESFVAKLRSKMAAALADIAAGFNNQHNIDNMRSELEQEEERIAHEIAACDAIRKENELLRQGLETRLEEIDSKLAALQVAHGAAIDRLFVAISEQAGAEYLSAAQQVAKTHARLCVIDRMLRARGLMPIHTNYTSNSSLKLPVFRLKCHRGLDHNVCPGRLFEEHRLWNDSALDAAYMDEVAAVKRSGVLIQG